MYQIPEPDDEEAITAPTVPSAPPPPPPPAPEPEVCESLWLPPCPACSWIALWRRPEMDVFERPGFYLARHTSAKFGQNYFMLRGCSHATNVGCNIGPTRNRLKLAVAWRRKVAILKADLFERFDEERRREILLRLGHPSERSADEAPLVLARELVGNVTAAVKAIR